jgi:hypothetical protein
MSRVCASPFYTCEIQKRRRDQVCFLRSSKQIDVAHQLRTQIDNRTREYLKSIPLSPSTCEKNSEYELDVASFFVSNNLKGNQERHMRVWSLRASSTVPKWQKKAETSDVSSRPVSKRKLTETDICPESLRRLCILPKEWWDEAHVSSPSSSPVTCDRLQGNITCQQSAPLSPHYPIKKERWSFRCFVYLQWPVKTSGNPWNVWTLRLSPFHAPKTL